MFGWPVWFLGEVGSLLPFAQVGLVSSGPLRPVGSLGPFGSVRSQLIFRLVGSPRPLKPAG